MIPTLQNFTRALLMPDLSFSTLQTARAVTDSRGLPRLSRTTRFAEAEIEWHAEHWLLSMPLAPQALLQIERTASKLRKLNTPLLAEYRILPREMHWQDSAGTEQTSDLILQHLPAGKSFADALLTEDKERLLSALDTLQEGLRELGFTHNNLKTENLRWCAGRFIPLRYHDARIGEGSDTEAFDDLRGKITAAPGTQTVCDMAVAYQPMQRLTGHRWTSHVFEGLICVEDDAGYGFVDTDNNPIIPAQFIWAGDFREGRAEVQTATGMGLIDRQGCYVIPPEYEIVDYDPSTSIIRVRLDGRWALFDYLGRRLTEFGTNNE